MNLRSVAAAILLCVAVGLGAAILLIIIYFCIKSSKCFHQATKKGPGRRDVKYAQVAPEDSCTEITNCTTLENLKEETNAASTGDTSTNKLMLSDNGKTAPTTVGSSYGKTAPAVGSVVPTVPDNRKMAFAVLDKGNAVPDKDGDKLDHATQQSTSKKIKRQNEAEKSRNRRLGHLHITLQYSKKDLLLFLVIHKICELHPADFDRINQVRLSMVSIPSKRFRGKTKFVPINEIKFGATFKFPNVSKADLFQSSMRFRLYGRHARLRMHLGKDELMGEVNVHLADVAQRERITASRPFKPPCTKPTKKHLLLDDKLHAKQREAKTNKKTQTLGDANGEVEITETSEVVTEDRIEVRPGE